MSNNSLNGKHRTSGKYDGSINLLYLTLSINFNSLYKTFFVSLQSYSYINYCPFSPHPISLPFSTSIAFFSCNIRGLKNANELFRNSLWKYDLCFFTQLLGFSECLLTFLLSPDSILLPLYFNCLLFM